MPKIINTFAEGLDKDTVPTSYSNKNYYDARNFSIVVAEDLSSATLSNTKGVTLKFRCTGTAHSPTNSTEAKIVGITELGEYLIIFIKEAWRDSIYEIPISVMEGWNSEIDLHDYFATYCVAFNYFNFGDRVEVIGREETGEIRKIYWIDGVNPLRFCNLALGKDVLLSYTLTEFEINQEVTLSTPTYSRLISGNLKAGVYQYAYLLYNQNGGQTAYSPLSQFIQVTETGLTAKSTDFRGSDIGTETSSGIEILINDTNDNFEFIRVVSVFYTTPSGIPEITIIYEGGKQDSIIISHTGSQLLGTLVLEDVVATPLTLIPKTLASKYNYLFVGNIEEQSFDVPFESFDARTYRFFNDGTSKMYNSYSDYAQNFVTFTSADYPATESEYNLNPLNYIGWDITTSGDNLTYTYQSDGVTIGGEGPNVSYGFITHTVPLCTYPSPLTGMRMKYTTDAYTEGLGGYSNPYENAFVGYQRDELYRLGVIFFNSKGQSSFVNWIGDIRMPRYASSGSAFNLTAASQTNANSLGIRFNFNFTELLNSIPDIVSYQIVRAERTYNDSTIVDTGYIGHLLKDDTSLFWGGYSYASSLEDNYPSLHSIVDTEHSLKSIVEYICAETNYNRNNEASYDRLDIYGGENVNICKRTTNDSYSVDNVILTNLSPLPTYNSTKTVDDAVKFSAQRSMTALQSLPSSFGSYNLSTRSHILADGSRGYKGTTLVLKLDSDITATTDHTSPYVLRRRIIYPYGGFSLSSIAGTAYYPCSPVTSIETTTLDVYGGDTYISIFEYNRTLWADEANGTWGGDRYAQVVQCVVESKLNLNYTVNPRWTALDDNLVKSTGIIELNLLYNAMWETSGVWEFYVNGSPPEYYTQDYNLYTYNPVYSLSTGGKSFVGKPLNFVNNSTYNTRVWKSEKKINGEITDSWLQFLPNNYLDLDNQFGELTRLYNHNNKLLYFQTKAFGIIPVEDREIISSTSGPTTIGTGGVLTRYDYISTNAGTSLFNSIQGTDNNLYFVDDNLKKICNLSDREGFRYLSDEKGLYSYMQSAILTNVNTAYNPKNKDIIFSFNNQSTPESLLYNEYTGTFVSFNDMVFKYGKYINGNMYIFDNLLNSSSKYYMAAGTIGTGSYGKYSLIYPIPSTYSPSTLDFIINPARNIVGRFDIIELATEVFDNGVTSNLTKTFNSLRIRNNYQDTGVLPLITSSNITRRFRTWRMNTLRDQSDDGRLVDNYAKLSLSFTNDGTTKLLVNDITTTFSLLNLR